MTNPFEKPENPQKILVTAALVEAPVLVLGVVLFLMTDNPIWIVAGALVGAAIMIPAVLKVAKRQERNDDASR